MGGGSPSWSALDCLQSLVSRRLSSPFPCCLAERGRPDGWRRIPDAKLFFHLVNVLIPPLLPVYSDQGASATPTSKRPRNIFSEEPSAFGGVKPYMPEHARDQGHGYAKICVLKELEGEFRFHVDGEVAYTVVEVVGLAITLHHVSKLWVINVVHRLPRIRRHSAFVKPINTLRPSGLASIWCLRRARDEPAVVSPNAAIMSFIIISNASRVIGGHITNRLF